MRKVPVMVNLRQDEAERMRAAVPAGMDLADAVRRFARAGLERVAPPTVPVEPTARAAPSRVVVETVELRGEPIREYLPLVAPALATAPAVDLIDFLTFAYPLAAWGKMTAGEIVEAFGADERPDRAAA